MYVLVCDICGLYVRMWARLGNSVCDVMCSVCGYICVLVIQVFSLGVDHVHTSMHMNLDPSRQIYR